MENERIELLKEILQDRKRIKLQRIYKPQGKLLCHCVQVGGSGYYFTTEKELYAYCDGRGFLKRSENSYYSKICEINLKFNYYPIVKEETFDPAKKGKLKTITFKVNEQLFFELYCCFYRGKKIMFETKVEVYAYCQGKKIISANENSFLNPHILKSECDK